MAKMVKTSKLQVTKTLTGKNPTSDNNIGIYIVVKLYKVENVDTKERDIVEILIKINQVQDTN